MSSILLGSLLSAKLQVLSVVNDWPEASLSTLPVKVMVSCQCICLTLVIGVSDREDLFKCATTCLDWQYTKNSYTLEKENGE